MLQEALKVGSLAEMRNVPADVILAAPNRGNQTIDGWFIPRSFQEILRSNQFNDVPILWTSNTEDVDWTRNPFANVRTDITLNNNGRHGGDASAGPLFGARFTHWNIRVTNGRAGLVKIDGLAPYSATVGIDEVTEFDQIDVPDFTGDLHTRLELYGSSGAVRSIRATTASFHICVSGGRETTHLPLADAPASVLGWGTAQRRHRAEPGSGSPG
jgi:hypothetical protein